MKKIITFLSLVLLISSIAPMMGEAAASSKTTTKYVNISSGKLNVRKTASTKAAVIAKLSKNSSVTVYTNANGWSKIKTSNKIGYVTSKYLYTKKSAPASPTTYRAKAVSVAKNELGTKYQWGGITPSGFDCSGLVKYSYGKAGKVLPRTAAEMYSKGSRVSALSTGDLMFFAPNKASRPTHVSIYVGSGTMIHAATSRGVSYSTTNNSYWKPKFIGAKRI